MRHLLIILMAASLAASEWPEFRGPTGQGHADAADLPLRWSETENIAWKTPLPGKGWSSPVLGDGVIWLTTATDGGRSLRVLRVDAGNGELLGNTEVFRLSSAPSIHSKNSHASPTPILDGDRVYAHFGAQGTAALNENGEVLWRNQEHSYNQVHGTGGSPVLVGDLLIFNCDGGDRQFVAALDKNTGKTAWRTPRGGGRMAFSTPLAIPRDGGQQVISTGGDKVASYDAATGRELWSVPYDGFSLVPRPVHGHGLVYVTTGFYSPELLAIHPENGRVEWRWSRGVPLTPSPVLVGEEIYIVSDSGIVTCLNARSGEQVWRARLDGDYSASPLHASGRIYFTNETGLSTVIRAGSKFEVVAKNQVNGRTMASLAAAEGALFLRTEAALYRIEAQ